MTAREGMRVDLDSASLIANLLALLPTSVAIADENGRIILSNSAFGELFCGFADINAMPQHEVDVPGRGTFEVETLPLNDNGFKIVYANDVTKEVRLRRQITRLEKMAAIGR